VEESLNFANTLIPLDVERRICLNNNWGSVGLAIGTIRTGGFSVVAYTLWLNECQDSGSNDSFYMPCYSRQMLNEENMIMKFRNIGGKQAKNKQ
jgi:hypothetical protein